MIRSLPLLKPVVALRNCTELIGYWLENERTSKRKSDEYKANQYCGGNNADRDEKKSHRISLQLKWFPICIDNGRFMRFFHISTIIAILLITIEWETNLTKHHHGQKRTFV